jgi:hypothetical protein
MENLDVLDRIGDPNSRMEWCATESKPYALMLEMLIERYPYLDWPSWWKIAEGETEVDSQKRYWKRRQSQNNKGVLLG